MKRELTRADILPMPAYAKVRPDKRREIVELKKRRRLAVGPHATIHFESFDTMWMQVHEMLFIEKGGEAQIEGELDAYNPLIPKGRELVGTVLFEIDDPIRRARTLARLGGVEETAFLSFAGETVRGVPEPDQDRTSDEGKASSVQFIHFPFSDAQVALFRQPGLQVTFGFSHPEYSHMTLLPEATRAELAGDFA